MLWARRTQKTAISAPYIRTVFLLTLKRCGDIMRKHVADIISFTLLVPYLTHLTFNTLTSLYYAGTKHQKLLKQAWL